MKKKDPKTKPKITTKKKVEEEKPKSKAGRKPSIQEKGPLILESLRLGNTNRGAAYSAGVTDIAFYQWLKKGREDIEDGIETEYSHFCEEVDRAIEAAKSYALECWRKHMPDDWRAAMAYLERRDKDNYALKQIMDVKQEVSQIAILELEDNGFGLNSNHPQEEDE